jgi:hypothetical protein
MPPELNKGEYNTMQRLSCVERVAVDITGARKCGVERLERVDTSTDRLNELRIGDIQIQVCQTWTNTRHIWPERNRFQRVATH